MTKREIAEMLASEIFPPGTNPAVVSDEIETMVKNEEKIALEARLWVTRRHKDDAETVEG